MQKYFDQSLHTKFVLTTLILVIGIFLAACGANTEELSLGDEAPDFTLTNANGQSVSLHDYTDRKQPVLLYFHMALG